MKGNPPLQEKTSDFQGKSDVVKWVCGLVRVTPHQHNPPRLPNIKELSLFGDVVVMGILGIRKVGYVL